MKLRKGLLIADIQNDFCPNGALGVKDGDKIIPAINKYINKFSKADLPVFITRDWHPKVTKHFKQFGGQWPVHCVQDTNGAKFHPRLKLPKVAMILSKGMNPKADSYSAFQAYDSSGVGLLNLLEIFGIKELFIGGIATDYCVKWSVMDALKYGFKIQILMDAIKGVNVNPRDSEEAIEEMVARGAKKVTVEKLSRILS